jgi:hypothetical protein
MTTIKKNEMTTRIRQKRMLCPYLVEQPYLAASEHSLGNTASDARITLARTVTLFFTETHTNFPKLTQTYRNSLKLTKTHRNSPNSSLFVYTN